MKIDLNQISFISPLLRKILIDVEIQLGFEFTITSLFRIGDDGVHGTLPLRACDLRCKDDITGKRIVDVINNTWQYDPERPDMKVAMFHDVGMGAHLHIQVHPDTIEL